MKKKLLLVVLAMLSFDAIHAEITWKLSDDGILTISGTDMPDYGISRAPWYYYGYKQEIKEVVIEEGVTNIGSAAFFGLKITSVSIPNSVNSIGVYAFGACTHISSITIPNSVKSIGDYAFSSCEALTSITIPNSVTSIGENAFDHCSGIASVTIPKSVTSIGKAPFTYCSNLNSIIVEEGNANYDSRNNCNAIIETKSNTLISGCNKTVIPNDVSAIVEYALAGFDFTSFIIPNSVKIIENGAFACCPNLTSVTIPSSVTSIGESVFMNCPTLNSIFVEKGNPIYDSRDNCNAIIETKTNTLISGCNNTVIPNSVTGIGNSAFCGSGLTSIVIPNSVTGMGTYAFNNCEALTSVTLSNSLTTIGESAFSSSGLISIDIPNSVTSIGKNAFWHCEALTSVTIPNSVASIGETAYSGCYALTSITIPNSVTTIGKFAFWHCEALTSITIPNSVTSIEAGAFDSCTNLTSVTVLATNPPVISDWTFDDNVKIHVLAGCKAAYEGAEFWKDFTIVEDAVTGIDAVERPAMISADKIFSISGQRLDKAAKGVNIINGRKVYVK